MLVFNPRSTQVSIDGQVLNDLDVLLHLDDEFTVADGEQHLFNLMSVRRLLLRYPSLQLINGWSKSLIEQGQHLEMRVVRDLPAASSAKPYTQLLLQKHRVLNRFELTPFMSETPRENVVDVQGHASTSMGIAFKDVPSVDFSDGVDFCGMDGDKAISLSMARLADIGTLPIVLAPATYEQIDVFANNNRTRPDYANVRREKTTLASPDLCLREVIHAVLMSINLDDEEDYTDELTRLRRMVRCLDPDGQD